MRLGIGSIFLYHGWIKLQNIGLSMGFFETLGLPGFLVYLVIAIEMLGGAAMILGVLVEYAGWILAFNMLAAIVLVKLPHGWQGIEFELLLLLVSVSVALIGPGKFVATELNDKKK